MMYTKHNHQSLCSWQFNISDITNVCKLLAVQVGDRSIAAILWFPPIPIEPTSSFNTVHSYNIDVDITRYVNISTNTPSNELQVGQWLCSGVLTWLELLTRPTLCISNAGNLIHQAIYFLQVQCGQNLFQNWLQNVSFLVLQESVLASAMKSSLSLIINQWLGGKRVSFKNRTLLPKIGPGNNDLAVWKVEGTLRNCLTAEGAVVHWGRTRS